MWEPENIMVVSSFWHNHHDDWYWTEPEEDEDDDDIVTYCDIYYCRECPKYGDDCDGKEENYG